jgi:hypothetical protein
MIASIILSIFCSRRKSWIWRRCKTTVFLKLIRLHSIRVWITPKNCMWYGKDINKENEEDAHHAVDEFILVYLYVLSFL